MNDYHNGDNLGLEPTTPPHEPPAAPQAAPSDEHVSVVGMPEFDALLDHIYEHGIASEGIIDRANAFARALLARHGQPAASAEPVAYAAFADNGNIRIWSREPLNVPGCVPLYTAPPAAQPKRRPYNASGSLSEYGVFPECDATPAAHAGGQAQAAIDAAMQRTSGSEK